jgi:hypothetical protein
MLQVCDAAPELEGSADLVVMEMGILHYFVDLRPLLGPGELAHDPGRRSARTGDGFQN